MCIYYIFDTALIKQINHIINLFFYNNEKTYVYNCRGSICHGKLRFK